MAIVFDATLAGVNSNSYVTVDEADTELEVRFDSAEWGSANDTDKQKALIMACRAIEAKDFLGVKYTLNQSLSFPRNFKDTTRTLQGNLIFIDGSIPVLPKDLKLAQILEANEILKRKDTLVNNRQTRDGIIREGVQWIQIGETYERYNKAYVSEFYSKEAEHLLSGIIRRGY